MPSCHPLVCGWGEDYVHLCPQRKKDWPNHTKENNLLTKWINQKGQSSNVKIQDIKKRKRKKKDPDSSNHLAILLAYSIPEKEQSQCTKADMLPSPPVSRDTQLQLCQTRKANGKSQKNLEVQRKMNSRQKEEEEKKKGRKK